MRVQLGGDGPDGVRTVRVKSSDGVTVHLVRCLPGGLWTCTCPMFVNRGKCRHVTLVRHRLAENIRSAGDLL